MRQPVHVDIPPVIVYCYVVAIAAFPPLYIPPIVVLTDCMATKAEKLAELQAELASIKAAQASARSGGQSMSIDGMSKSNWNPKDLQSERTRVEKSIQRLLRGGRGIVIDMSYTTAADVGDPYRSGSEVLL
jgi:hypothetical protein